MPTSILIARLIGPLMVVVGLVVLANPRLLRAVIEDFMGSRALIFLAGFLTLLAGLAIVNTHNLWVLDWRVIITIFGWLGVVGGVIRIAFPAQIVAIGEAMLARQAALRVWSAAPLVLGAFLAFKGYL